MKTAHEARARNLLELFFYQQVIRSSFVSDLTKMAEAEGCFEERFSETVRQFLVIYVRFH